MPAELERQLRTQVNRLHPNWSEERKNAYVYGTMQKVTSWKPSTQKKKANWDGYRKKKKK